MLDRAPPQGETLKPGPDFLDPEQLLAPLRHARKLLLAVSGGPDSTSASSRLPAMTLRLDTLGVTSPPSGWRRASSLSLSAMGTRLLPHLTFNRLSA